jgi:hypothetical protein
MCILRCSKLVSESAIVQCVPCHGYSPDAAFKRFTSLSLSMSSRLALNEHDVAFQPTLSPTSSQSDLESHALPLSQTGCILVIAGSLVNVALFYQGPEVRTKPNLEVPQHLILIAI